MDFRYLFACPSNRGKTVTEKLLNTVSYCQKIQLGTVSIS